MKKSAMSIHEKKEIKKTRKAMDNQKQTNEVEKKKKKRNKVKKKDKQYHLYSGDSYTPQKKGREGR